SPRTAGGLCQPSPLKQQRRANFAEPHGHGPFRTASFLRFASPIEEPYCIIRILAAQPLIGSFNRKGAAEVRQSFLSQMPCFFMLPRLWAAIVTAISCGKMPMKETHNPH